MLLLRLSQDIYPGGHHANPKRHFLELAFVWERGIMLLLRVSQFTFEGASMPPYNQLFLFFRNCH